MPRILIVDDSEQMRRLVQAVAEGVGWHVALAGSLQGVQNLLPEIDSDPRRAVEIHAAIVDGQFPLGDGERPQDDAGAKTAEYLRRVRPDIQIIALSGHDSDTLKWANPGMALRKPVSVADLRAAFKKLSA